MNEIFVKLSHFSSFHDIICMAQLKLVELTLHCSAGCSAAAQLRKIDFETSLGILSRNVLVCGCINYSCCDLDFGMHYTKGKQFEVYLALTFFILKYNFSAQCRQLYRCDG